MPNPNLGYGQQSEASIDQVNIWMRSTPWYQQQMRAWGQDPGHPTLTESQSQQILRMAQANGVVVDQGNMEVDDHGNFNPIGHKLRNTLIVAGVAAATIASMGAAGVFSGAGGAASAGAGGSAAAGSTAAAGAGAAGAGAAGAGGVTTAGILGGGGAAAGAAGLGRDLLRYGLPVAGGLVGGIIQANAEGRASDAQQRYLEEALAYEKEKDQYQRGIDAQAVAREEQRYGNYQGRIAPWIANGTTSNDRMASLLGLPARAGVSGGYAGGGPSAPNVDVGDAPQKFLSAVREAGLDPVAVQGHGQVIADAVNKKYPGLGVTVDPKTDAILWPGIGSIDVTVDSGKGGFSFRPDGYVPASAVPSRSYAATVPTATAPQSSAAMVSLRAPDGSVKQVNQADVQHYLSLGAVPA